jgi:CDP-diacylglycerol--glycerol-3-phosphate 3-phosphatidyltransferase
MSTANIITLSRLPLLLLLVGLLYLQWAPAALAALALLAVLYLMDWFDGYWARTKNQVTDLGSVLDIAIDRVVENVLWIVFAHLGRTPVWVPILFIIRSFVVDGLRGFALARGYSAFGMMHSSWGRFLVSGRFMRGLYGLAKGLALEECGDPITDPIKLSLPQAVNEDGVIKGRVIEVDLFGNLITNIPASMIPAAPILVLVGDNECMGVGQSYASLNNTAPGAIIGSHGRLEIALKNGSAADFLGAGVGDRVELTVI